MRKPIILDDSTCSNEPNKLGSTKMMSIYRMSDAQPDWKENDPSQPDYIANKDLAEKLRPLYVDGQLVLDSSHESGALCLLSGQNILLEVTEDKSIRIHAADNPGGGEGPGCNCPKIEFENGFVVKEEVEGFEKREIVSLDVEYINEQLILPALNGISSQVSALEAVAALLVGEDADKSIRQIAEEVIAAADIVTSGSVEELTKNYVQEELAAWVVSSGFNNIVEVVDITKPITQYVEEEINKKISGGEGGTSVPATSEILGSVKIDDSTIKMNEKQQIYIAEMSTDRLVQGEQTLVLNGGNDL